MKNIEQILKDAGLEVSEDQLASVTKAVGENYKTVADYNKQVTKTEKAEADRDSLKEQLSTANDTLEKFKDIDPEKTASEIEGYKQKIAEVEEKAAKQITERDQRDYLKAEFDKLGIASERIRKSLAKEIMGEDGLKWKNGAFMGLSDYLAGENEKDHFYQTEEEKQAAAQQEKTSEQQRTAASNAPKFTAKSEGKPATESDKPLFNFGFTPIRDVKKG
jgi:hypothetical protein